MTDERPQVRIRMGDGETASARSSTVEVVLPLDMEGDLAQQIRTAARVVNAELRTAERERRNPPPSAQGFGSVEVPDDLLPALTASVEREQAKAAKRAALVFGDEVGVVASGPDDVQA